MIQDKQSTKNKKILENLMHVKQRMIVRSTRSEITINIIGNLENYRLICFITEAIEKNKFN